MQKLVLNFLSTFFYALQPINSLNPKKWHIIQYISRACGGTLEWGHRGFTKTIIDGPRDVVYNLENNVQDQKWFKVGELPCLKGSEQDSMPQIRSPAQQNTVFLPKEGNKYSSELLVNSGAYLPVKCKSCSSPSSLADVTADRYIKIRLR